MGAFVVEYVSARKLAPYGLLPLLVETYGARIIVLRDHHTAVLAVLLLHGGVRAQETFRRRLALKRRYDFCGETSFRRSLLAVKDAPVAPAMDDERIFSIVHLEVPVKHLRTVVRRSS